MEEKKLDATCAGGSSKGGCGMHCGCCACKAIKGLVLVLIGGMIGYGIAHRRYDRWMHRMCPMEVASPERMGGAPMALPAPPRKIK